ncbi:MBL fold metallo-hydrolase [Glaciecola sp. MH2013]|nr:MBL fold metallo-hydrolase [Glaciecola sp. MH2013]
MITYSLWVLGKEAMTGSIDTKRAINSHYNNGRFENEDKRVKQDFSKLGSILKRYLFKKRIEPVPKSVPVVPIDHATLNETQDHIYRLGHSSLLLNLSQSIWLIDPVFSDRASPFSWTGPKRFHEVPLDLGPIPSITGVIISHDHYDHLDKQTIKMLSDKTEYFVVPLGLESHLIKWGVPRYKIYSLDWWENINLQNLSITATPSQHFSGRGLQDGNKTLWASFVINTPKHKLFYSGDSGYFEGFKEIGKRFGPFDLTLIETGAYDKDWPDIHMFPEESVQAHIDLNGKVLMPVHNGTFDLALHPWYEPFERLLTSAESQGVLTSIPKMGEAVPLSNPEKAFTWR